MSKVIYHLTSEHIFYLLEQNECFLTFKADGIYKNDKIIDYDGKLEYEEIGEKKYIFNFTNEDNKHKNIQERMFDLLDLNNIKFDKHLFQTEITHENIYDIINKYINLYDDIQSNIIPKMYLKINKQSLLSILHILMNYYPNINFPTDGWVITPSNNKFIAKIKCIVAIKHVEIFFHLKLTVKEKY